MLTINTFRIFATLSVAILGCLGATNLVAALFFPSETLNASSHSFTTLYWLWVISEYFVISLCVATPVSLGGMFAPYFLGWNSSPLDLPKPANMPYRLNFALCCLRDGLILFGIYSVARTVLCLFDTSLGRLLSQTPDIVFALGITLAGVVFAGIFHVFQRNRIRKRIAEMEANNPELLQWAAPYLPKGIVGDSKGS